MKLWVCYYEWSDGNSEPWVIFDTHAAALDWCANNGHSSSAFVELILNEK